MPLLVSERAAGDTGSNENGPGRHDRLSPRDQQLP